MRVTVLKSFGYSEDGIFIRKMFDGDVIDIKDDLASGLIAARCVAPVTFAKPTVNAEAVEPPKVTAPADRAELSIRHTGRGRYAIYRGDERLTQDALDKDGAESALAAMRDAPISENAEG